MANSLVLDLGNTALKYGAFAAGALQEAGTLTEPAQLLALWRHVRPAQAILSTVAADAATQPWLAALAEADALARVLPFRPGFTPVPVRNAYATPHTLGPDRLAGAVGAAGLRPGRPTLVVDAGTALKLDLVTADGTYHGGSIGPGLRMRLQALHTLTGRLPLLALPPPEEAEVQLIGDSTASAMLSGVLRGAAAEVSGLVAEYERRYPGLGVVLTGGDALYLQASLGAGRRIFVVPELVLLGLEMILRYNVAY